MPKFGIQDGLLGYFWDRIKKIVIFEINTVEFM